VLTCNLKFSEHCVLNKKTKVKFSSVIHCSGSFLDYVHVYVWDPTKIASLRGNRYFISFVDDLFRHYWVYSKRQVFEVLDLFMK